MAKKKLLTGKELEDALFVLGSEHRKPEMVISKNLENKICPLLSIDVIDTEHPELSLANISFLIGSGYHTDFLSYNREQLDEFGDLLADLVFYNK